MWIISRASPIWDFCANTLLECENSDTWLICQYPSFYLDIFQLSFKYGLNSCDKYILESQHCTVKPWITFIIKNGLSAALQ